MITFTIDNQHKVFLECFNNPISGKYKTILQKLISKGMQIDNQISFIRFMSVDKQKKLLLTSIDSVNEFMGHQYIDTKNVQWDRDFFNQAHELFEKLNGTFTNPTKLIVIAPDKIKEDIRLINTLVHQLEEQGTKQWRFQWHKEHTIRQKMIDEDYNTMVFDTVPNTMYLHYNEVGKSTIDVFNDQLDINYPNIVNNHYIGPDIRYYNSTEHCFGDNFLIWCKDKNIDPYRKQNGLGLYPVGTYTTNFTNDDISVESRWTNVEISS
jgi:hypothetical protein